MQLSGSVYLRSDQYHNLSSYCDERVCLICLYVHLHTPISGVRNRMSKFHQIVDARHMWPCLGSHLPALYELTTCCVGLLLVSIVNNVMLVCQTQRK